MVRREEPNRKKFQDAFVSSARLRLSFLVAIGIIVLHMSRGNLHIAIGPMINITNSPKLHFLEFGEKETTVLSQCFSSSSSFYSEDESEMAADTNLTTQHLPSRRKRETMDIPDAKEIYLSLTTEQAAALLGAFYFGYIISPILGGRLADLYGTKRVFGSAIFVDTFVNLVTPMAIKSHYVFLIVLRVIMGLFQGSTLPSLHSLMARWIPPKERPCFIAFSYLAYLVGMPMTFAFHTFILNHLDWESVFYITASISLMWLLVWTSFMYDEPSDHPRITTKEKNYICTTTHNAGTSLDRLPSAPWQRIITSSSLMAISLAHAGNMFGFSMIIHQFPVYFYTILGLPLKKDNFLFFLLPVAIYAACNLWACVECQMIKRKCLTTTIRKRLLVATGFVCPAILYVAIGYVRCDTWWAASLVGVGILLQGAAIVGYGDAHLYIAPNFAGTCFGISEAVAVGVATIGRIAVKYFTYQAEFPEWEVVFWVILLVYFFCALFFVLFSSFKLLPWNKYGLEATQGELEMMTKFTSHRNSEAYG